MSLLIRHVLPMALDLDVYQENQLALFFSILYLPTFIQKKLECTHQLPTFCPIPH